MNPQDQNKPKAPEQPVIAKAKFSTEDKNHKDGACTKPADKDAAACSTDKKSCDTK